WPRPVRPPGCRSSFSRERSIGGHLRPCQQTSLSRGYSSVPSTYLCVSRDLQDTVGNGEENRERATSELGGHEQVYQLWPTPKPTIAGSDEPADSQGEQQGQVGEQGQPGAGDHQARPGGQRTLIPLPATRGA